MNTMLSRVFLLNEQHLSLSDMHHSSILIQRVIPGVKYIFFEDLLPKVIFALERSCITSAVRKSMLDMPVPGASRNRGY